MKVEKSRYPPVGGNCNLPPSRLKFPRPLGGGVSSPDTLVAAGVPSSGEVSRQKRGNKRDAIRLATHVKLVLVISGEFMTPS